MLKRAKNNNKGFSLIEVLVALMIMVGAIIVVSSAWSGNFLRVRKSNLYNNVSFLLERKMAEIDAKYRGRPIGEIPEEESGEFDNFPNYKWTLETKPFEMPDLTASLTAQDGGANEMMVTLIKQYTEMVNQSVKEAKVSVVVNAGEREVKYSVTTFFVDYTQQQGALGGGAGAAGGGMPAGGPGQ